MTRERWGLVALLALGLLAGLASWRLLLLPALEVDPTPLGTLPVEVGEWYGYELPVEDGIAEMLAADFHVQRAYVHRMESLVWLYVGYYGTGRGGRPEHTPWICYPSNGWEIVEDRVVRVDAAPDREANELLVENEGEQRLVHFWYASQRRSGMLDPLDQMADRLIGRVSDGRADGSLVRLSTPIFEDEDIALARSRLVAFGREIEPLLRERWPTESAVHEGP